LRPISEWLFHKYIWHSKGITFRGGLYENAIARMHSEHHHNPHDIDGIFFSAKTILVLSGVVLGSLALIFSLGDSLIMLVGYLIGILLHEWFHFLSRSRVSPRSMYLRNVISHHRHHHYKDSESCYCVSQIWADRLLRTDRIGKGAAE